MRSVIERDDSWERDYSAVHLVTDYLHLQPHSRALHLHQTECLHYLINKGHFCSAYQRCK